MVQHRINTGIGVAAIGPRFPWAPFPCRAGERRDERATQVWLQKQADAAGCSQPTKVDAPDLNGAWHQKQTPLQA